MTDKTGSTGRSQRLYAAVFFAGFSTMGFEMVASRIMTPWFGGGIDTWAALISTVLVALTLGYFGGGALAASEKTPVKIGGGVMAAAFYMAVLPLLYPGSMRWMLEHVGDGVGALLLTSFLLCFVPVALLGAFAPCSVDLMNAIRPGKDPGEVAGRLYGVSTLGSVCGTLGAAFVLIPRVGSANLTLLLAGCTFVAALLVWTLTE